MKISLPLHLRRQANLQLLVEEFGGVTALAGQVSSPRSHLSAVLSGDKPCGNRLAAKIEEKTGREPGWMDSEQEPAAPQAEAQASHSEAELRRSLNVIRDLLAQAHGAQSAIAGEALRLLALMPDSERAFSNALAALIPTSGEQSPRESGAGLRLAHAMSPGADETSPADPQVLGAEQERDVWTHRGVPGGTERTDESTIYQRPASTARKKVKR